jgi:hypothetical protein
MFHPNMLLALVSALLADLSTEQAEFLHMLRAASHQPRGERTDIGTIAIEFDASRKRIHFPLRKAGCRAVLAFHRTCIACLDTGTIPFMSHRSSPSSFLFPLSRE